MSLWPVWKGGTITAADLADNIYIYSPAIIVNEMINRLLVLLDYSRYFMYFLIYHWISGAEKLVCCMMCIYKLQLK